MKERQEERAKRDATNKPTRDDVHEQREADQPREGVVKKEGARPVTQSEIDRERADWEGMGQAQQVPPSSEGESASATGKPRPGAPSIVHTPRKG